MRGLVLVDKPAGYTSHDVVARLRRIYGQRRIGHAGTLDPEATGLMVVALGNVTRLLDYYQAKSKLYGAEVVFGVETDSYDSSGNIVSTTVVERLDLDLLDQAVSAQIGNISQLPPVVSAIKVKGKRLYQYHRESQEVEIRPRQVRVDRIEYSLVDEPHVIRIEVECGPGTYIRSIAHDLGEALGVGAHLRNLRRLRSGSFSIEEALPLDRVESETSLDPLSALRDFEIVGVSGAEAAKARNGSALVLGECSKDEVLVFDSSGGALIDWSQVVGLFRRASQDHYRASVVLPVIN